MGAGNFAIGQVSIVVVAQYHNPSILNADFLQRNGIVPKEWGWKAVEGAVATPAFSQVTFEGGFSIVAQFDRLIFSESDETSIPEKTRIADVVTKYVETLPHVDYRAVGTNAKGHIPADSEEYTTKFIQDLLLCDGRWRTFGTTPVKSAVKLYYTVDSATLTLSIEEGRVALNSEQQRPCVLLQGNFHRDLVGATHEERRKCLMSFVAGWKKDYASYMDLIENYILAEGARSC